MQRISAVLLRLVVGYFAGIRNARGGFNKTMYGCLPLVPICLLLGFCQLAVTGQTVRATPTPVVAALLSQADVISTAAATKPIVVPSTSVPTRTVVSTPDPTLTVAPSDVPAPTALPPTATTEPTATLEPTTTDTPIPTPTIGPPDGRADSTVRMRSEPSTNGVVLGTVEEGVVVRLRYRSPDRLWFSVQRPDGTIGWVSAEFLIVDPRVAESTDVSSTDSAIVIPPTAVPVPAAQPPAAPAAPSGGRIGAICNDGTRSSATGRGACSHHGGVSRWLYN